MQTDDTTRTPETLSVTFDVTGFEAEQVSALAFEAEVQGEESDRHPEATVLRTRHERRMWLVRDIESPDLKPFQSFHRTRAEAEERIANSTRHDREHGERPGHTYLEAVEVMRESRPCAICGTEVESENPDVDFCRTCFYTGAAFGRTREAQLDAFRKALPGFNVTVEHTGGGCFWLAFYPPEFVPSEEERTLESTYYYATDGDASLPSLKRPGDAEWTDILSGGWGILVRTRGDEDMCGEGKILLQAGPERPSIPYPGTHEAALADPEWSAYYKASEAHAAAYPADTFTDDDVIQAILDDRKGGDES